jgi:hypothetical protein
MDKAVRLSAFYLGQARLLLQLYQQREELRLDQQVLLSILRDSGSKDAGGVLPTSLLFEAFNSKVPTHIQLPNTRKLTALLKELAALAKVTLTFRPMRCQSALFGLASYGVTSNHAQAVVPLKQYIHHGISNSARQLLESPPAVIGQKMAISIS